MAKDYQNMTEKISKDKEKELYRYRYQTRSHPEYRKVALQPRVTSKSMSKQLMSKTSHRQCNGITKAGKQCKNKAQKGRFFCKQHKDQAKDLTVILRAEGFSKQDP